MSRKLGSHLTEETKKKISIAVSLAITGKHPSQETREKIRAVLKGRRKFSDADLREHRAIAQHKYWLSHREQIREGRSRYDNGRKNKRSEYIAAHRKERGDYRLMYKYKMSYSDKDALLAGQGGVCAICKKPDWNGRGPHIDHDHATGKVRGILCHHCNAALGFIKDNPNIARSMADYLEK